jgi:hypothetical protein
MSISALIRPLGAFVKQNGQGIGIAEVCQFEVMVVVEELHVGSVTASANHFEFTHEGAPILGTTPLGGAIQGQMT